MQISKVIMYSTNGKGTPYLLVDHVNEKLIRGTMDESPLAYGGIGVTLGTHKELRELATTYRRLGYYLHEAQDLTAEQRHGVGKTQDVEIRIPYQRLNVELAEAYDRVKGAIDAPNKIVNDWLWGRIVNMARRTLMNVGAGYTYDELVANAWVISGIGGRGLQKFTLEGDDSDTTLAVYERAGKGWKEVAREPFVDTPPECAKQVAQYLPHVRAGLRDITAGEAVVMHLVIRNGDRTVII